ncbi:hypothetical protein CDD82_4595 [Ophiocordyceps australis]|uniref:HAM1-like N-terminal domain-containing protein n=1 Tax=Ophiocordyceps australis TaxID=1399860 RepID=A0A2C5YAL9_9HYPO|nr:hypothetical protein CDD82_4595 [Ophiocordyceps australis]
MAASWLGLGSSSRSSRHGEREPLLPQYNAETDRQARLKEKMHSYMMLRALSGGYMPCTEQLVVLLRTLLSADILNPAAASELSTAGRALTRSVKLWLTQFIELLQDKNSHDELQDLIWYLSHARLDLDLDDMSARAAASKTKANASATMASLRTIGSLLLTNSDFRIFLSDLGNIGREVFRDTAYALSNVSHQAGERLQPRGDDADKASCDANRDPQAPSRDELQEQVQEVAQVVASGAAEVATEAGHSLTEHIGGDEQRALVEHLKQAVVKLRQRSDYSTSVSMLSLLLQRYLAAYTRLASDAVQAIEEDVGSSREADEAASNFWRLIKSFGDAQLWAQVEEAFERVVEAGREDQGLEALLRQLSDSLQEMLMDPSFLDRAQERFDELRRKVKDMTSKQPIADSMQQLIERLQAALMAVRDDEGIVKLMATSERIAHLLSPKGQYANSQLVGDSVSVLVPLLMSAVQHIAVPRVEVSTPDMDLLLENLVLQPGRSINHSSFLPYKMRMSTLSDIEVSREVVGTRSRVTTLLRIKLSGLSVAADEVGYWIRLHSGLLRMSDSGLVSFHLDERGIDVRLDIEIGRERLEEIVTLRSVDVRIHKLSYQVGKSRLSWMAWLFKPLVRRVVRRALEARMAEAIGQGLGTLNRELVFARERLRATRIANPDHVWTFVRAVAARLRPAPDPDVDARVGVWASGREPFRGRYTPGSLVRLWEEEGRDAEQRVYEGGKGGWRNAVFDVETTTATTTVTTGG